MSLSYVLLRNPTPTTEIYTLSLHDALPISLIHIIVETETAPSKRVRERSSKGIADRKSTRLNSSHVAISYAVFCLKKKLTAWLRTRAFSLVRFGLNWDLMFAT